MMRVCSDPRSAGAQWWSSAADLPTAWDEHLPQDHFLRKATQLAHESARLQDFQMQFVAVADKRGRFILQAAFAVLHIRASAVRDDDWNAGLRAVWRGFAGIARPKLLIGGHPYRHDVSSVHRAAALSAWEGFGLYEVLLREAGRNVKASAILVKDPDPQFVPYFRNFARNYSPMRNDISMEMDLPPAWHSAADYAGSLKHKYAQRYRKVRSACAGVQIRELDVAETHTLAGVLYDLYRGVAANQAVRMGYLSPGFLPALKAHYGDSLRIWLWEQDGVPVAFTSAWVEEGVFDMFYIGFDYSRNASLQLYFNILFFAVEQAITAQASRLILGRTALEAKARVGCQPRYLDTFLYIRNPLLRRWVNEQTSRRFREEGAWEERHPFKAG